jgi:hypothetical protein
MAYSRPACLKTKESDSLPPPQGTDVNRVALALEEKGQLKP